MKTNAFCLSQYKLDVLELAASQVDKQAANYAQRAAAPHKEHQGVQQDCPDTGRK